MAANLSFHQRSKTCLLGSLLGLMLLIGCSGSSDSSSSTQQTTEGGMSAAQLLEKMRAVYREAKSYSDSASYLRRSVLRGEGVERESSFYQMSLTYERPNKIRFKFQEAVTNSAADENYDIASNGMVVHSAASAVPQQIHEAIAPLALTPENFIPEPAVRAAILRMSLEDLYPPIVMLMSDQSERAVFPEDTNPKLLEGKKLGEVDCYRVSMTNPAGQRVLWIDSNSFLLRRMELPIDSDIKMLDPNDIYSQISIYIDFKDSALDSEIDLATFELEIPEGARRVRRFIPPAPKPPSPDLGEPVGDFQFVTFDGEEITKETFAGKITILDFWFTGCPPCKAQTPVLNKVYEAFKDNEEVAFYAVSTDPPRITSEVVAKTLVSWGGNMPVLRDLKGSGYEKLHVRETPTLILVGRDGRLQLYQRGAHPRPEPLIGEIQKLLDGEDLAAAALARHERQVQDSEQALEAATIKESIVEVEVARPEIPAQSLPEHLQVEQLWQSSVEDLKQPGDVLVIEGATEGETSVLVLDEGAEVVAFDSSGTVLDRHQLPEHEEQSNGFLRTAVDGEGRRWYLASGIGWQQVFLFDQQWNSTLSFPDEAHSGIGDVLLADIAGSGTPIMYVGYWGGMGVHGGTIDGRRLWANRRLNHVLQVVGGPAAAEGNRQVWCTSTRGTVMQLSAEGKSVKELYVAGHSLMAVSVAEADDGSSASYCGLAVRNVGQYRVVGFDEKGSVAWEYELPRGEYSQQVPRIQPIRLAKAQSAWMVAAADGSIHWLSSTGELIDIFTYGDTLTGLAVSYQDDAPTLWVATLKNLTAWAIKSTLESAPAAEP